MIRNHLMVLKGYKERKYLRLLCYLGNQEKYHSVNKPIVGNQINNNTRSQRYIPVFLLRQLNHFILQHRKSLNQFRTGFFRLYHFINKTSLSR